MEQCLPLGALYSSGVNSLEKHEKREQESVRQQPCIWGALKPPHPVHLGDRGVECGGGSPLCRGELKEVRK